GLGLLAAAAEKAEVERVRLGEGEDVVLEVTLLLVREDDLLPRSDDEERRVEPGVLLKDPLSLRAGGGRDGLSVERLERDDDVPRAALEPLGEEDRAFDGAGRVRAAQDRVGRERPIAREGRQHERADGPRGSPHAVTSWTSRQSRRAW